MVYFFYIFFFVIELLNSWRSRSWRRLVDRPVFWLWLSVSLSIIIVICRIAMPKDSVFYMVGSLGFSMLGAFSLTAYIISRGLLILFKISGEGEQHPTCLTIRKLMRHPVLVYFLIFVQNRLLNQAKKYWKAAVY